MAKKDKINLSQAQISQEELSQYGEAIKILSMQEQLTDKLLLVDEKIEEISDKVNQPIESKTLIINSPCCLENPRQPM